MSAVNRRTSGARLGDVAVGATILYGGGEWVVKTKGPSRASLVTTEPRGWTTDRTSAPLDERVRVVEDASMRDPIEKRNYGRLRREARKRETADLRELLDRLPRAASAQRIVVRDELAWRNRDAGS